MIISFCGCSGSDFTAPGVTTAPADSTPGETAADDILWEDTMRKLCQCDAPLTLTMDTLVYDAREFGFTSKGKNDASVLLDDAVRAISEKGGGILYFPEGFYYLETEAVINNDGSGAWVCLAGDTNGKTVFKVDRKIKENAAVTVKRDNTHFAFLSFESQSKTAPVMSVTADNSSLYACNFKTMVKENLGPLLRVSGSYDTVKQCDFNTFAAQSCYGVGFVKIPGVRSYGNVLCDCHFGTLYDKAALVCSEDPKGAPENISVVRNLFLTKSDPQIEVLAANGILIADNMLDCTQTSIELSPDGYGIFNAEIRDNWMGGSNYGVLMGKSGEGFGGKINIHHNYIWAPGGVIVRNSHFSDITVKNDYFVLSAGNAVYMPEALRLKVSGNRVANIGSREPEIEIFITDEASSIDTDGFATSSIGKKADLSGDYFTVPEVGEAPERNFSKMPDITGNVTIASIGTGYCNVRDFGAKGDGVTDDTDAVRKAISKAKSVSGTVYFPEGNYLITETLKISKDDSKILTFKGDGLSSKITGAETLEGPVFEILMKYNFNVRDLYFEHRGVGSCIKTLYIKVFDSYFTASSKNNAPLLAFAGSNCWTYRTSYVTNNPDAYAISYIKYDNEISINDFIIENTISGSGKGIIVGDGKFPEDGRIEGLKIISNNFTNTGATDVEIYEILHIDIGHNHMSGAASGIYLSQLGHGADGVYIHHNDISCDGPCITSGLTEEGKTYISMVVVHDNHLKSAKGDTITQPVPFTSQMIEK